MKYNSTALHSSTAKERCSPAVESIVTREKSGIGSSPSLANRLTNHGYACWLLACHNARSCTLGQERESVIPTPCYHSRHSFGRITDDSLLSKTRRQHGCRHPGNTSNWISRISVQRFFRHGIFGWVDSQWLSTTIVLETCYEYRCCFGLG